MPMFITHAKVCNEVLNKSKNKEMKNGLNYKLLLIGSYIPDISLTGLATVEETHGRCFEFYDYLKKNAPKYLPLAVGMIIHERLDHYAHNNPGYVIEKSESLLDLIERYDPNNPLDRRRSGHSLAELALDYVVSTPTIISLMNQGRKVRKKILDDIAYHLATFWKKSNESRKEIAKVLHFYKNFHFKKFLKFEELGKLWADFTFYVVNSEKLLSKSKIVRFQGKLGFIGNRISSLKNKGVITMFAESTKRLTDYNKFISESVKKIHNEVVLCKKLI